MPLRKKKKFNIYKIIAVAIVIAILALMIISFPAPQTMTEVVLS